MAKIRLFIDHPLAEGQAVPLNPDQAHYLSAVMRQGPGDEILVFNGRDGEWLTRIERIAKRGGDLVAQAARAPQLDPPDLWLIFAPIKKARTDFIVEKAVELGAARILPVQTRHTNSERIRQDRLQAHATEAAEQCGATYVPEVADLIRLDKLLANWDATRRLYWCDEALAGQTPALSGLNEPTPSAILIGPEGGFSADEQTRLRALTFVHPLTLGPRILRADTAAVAALTLWQAALGDWS